MPEYTAPEPPFMENNKYGYRVNIGNPYRYDRITALDIKPKTEEAEAESGGTEKSIKK